MNMTGIIFSNIYDSTLGELTNHRTVASLPFGGRYRLVDFVLSALVGAQIHEIGIVTRNKYGSLMDHVGWGKDWDLNRKNGGIKFLTPFLKTSDTAAIGNRIEALNSVMDYIKSALPEYCIVCDSNIVMNIDLEKFMDYHEQKGGDITFAYTSMPVVSKELEVNGVGYRVAKQGKDLVMNLGFSHQVIMPEPDGITVEVPNPNKIIISGPNKQQVGQFAAEVREKRPPEPYKGKGIKYVDEVIRRKVGKTGGKK